jgi:hypothetical protein
LGDSFYFFLLEATVTMPFIPRHTPIIATGATIVTTVFTGATGMGKGFLGIYAYEEE